MRLTTNDCSACDLGDEALLRAATTGLLAGGISHDLNNLLMCIAATASALRGEVGRDGARSLDAIGDAVQQAGRLLELLVGGPTGPTGERVCRLDDVVRSVEAVLARVAERSHVHVVAEATPTLAAIAPAEAEQVLMNLALNGIEAMPGGGELRLGVRPRAGRAELRVRDAGRGIASEDLAAIFQPGWSSKKGRRRGVGLTVVRRVVERAGGQVAVASAPGGGAEFVVALPLAEVGAR